MISPSSTLRCILSRRIRKISLEGTRFNSNKVEISFVDFTDHKSLIIKEDFITREEEKFLLDDVETKLKRMKYEFDHWDGVIHGYREIQKLNWSAPAQRVIGRLRSLVPPPILPHTHVLDLSADGYIKPHTDSIEYCGNALAVLTLLSDAVIKLEHCDKTGEWFKMLIKRNSVYVMEGKLRYEYKHSILVGEEAVINGERVEKGRRLSVIVRADVTQE